MTKLEHLKDLLQKNEKALEKLPRFGSEYQMTEFYIELLKEDIRLEKAFS
jgi:hypothetical protein